jgi:hypothetical protein
MFKFYTELTFENSVEHKKPNWSVEDPYSFRQWYYEDITGKDTLLVTVGDSWTWGDHLGSIDWDKSVDDPARLTQVYGRLLANKLNADWINLALPGCSNYWMLEQLQDLQHHFVRVQNQYKRIIVVVTLTEDLREATYTKRIDVMTPYKKLWDESNTLTEFLNSVEAYTVSQFTDYFAQIPFVEYRIGRAFTDFLTHSSGLDKTWCDVIQDNVKYPYYERPVPFIGQLSIKPLTEKFIGNDIDRKSEFIDIMMAVERRWNFLGHSEYNLKGSTCHPNPAGHALWADYVFGQIL